MARVNVVPQAASAAGVQLAYAAPTVDGIMIPGDGETKVLVKNTNAADLTVTVQTPLTEGGLAVVEQTVVVPATTGERLIGPFRQDVYNRPTGAGDGGMVYVDFSLQASVTYAVVTG